MPHLLAVRTYVVLCVACLLGVGGGALLVAADAPSALFYALGVVLVGLSTLQALKPGVGIRPLRKRSAVEEQQDIAAEPREVAPPFVEQQEVAPPSDEQMREAKARANAAEWLTLYLHRHGATTRDELLGAAAQNGIDEASIAKALTDMGIELHLPDTVKELLAEDREPEAEDHEPEAMEPRTLSVGESLVGEGNEVAHIDLLIGSKSGPVGKAFAGALVNQKEGHTTSSRWSRPTSRANPTPSSPTR
jgi:hypothetical protein